MKRYSKRISRSLWLLVLSLVCGLTVAQENNTVTKTYLYDEAGNRIQSGNVDVVGETRVYFDEQGRLLQTQTKQNANDLIMAIQPIYGRFGRSVINTLPAPIGPAGSAFGYNPNFVLRSTAVPYDYRHFDLEATANQLPGEVFNPQTVGGTDVAYSLGWYYSSQNNIEEVPVTGIPYVREAYRNNGSEEVAYTTQPGDQIGMGTGHEMFQECRPITDQLHEYLELRSLLLPLLDLIEDGAIDQGHILGESQRADLMTATETVVLGPGGSLKLLPGFNNQGFTLKVEARRFSDYIDVAKGNTYNYSRDPNGKEAHVFLDAFDNPIARAFSSTDNPELQGWSYMFYDDGQRLIASITPNGVEAWRSGVPLEDIDMKRYTYNHRGQLLSLTEADAGTITYKYRRDGKLRFSQNAKQSAESTGGNHVFSFSNYDAHGRLIKVGEYYGSLDYETDLDAKLETIGADGGLNLSANNHRDWVDTHFDIPATNITAETGLTHLSQRFLLGAVSATENEHAFSWFSYTDEGKVSWELQKPKQLNKAFLVSYTHDYNGKLLTRTFQEYEVNGGTATLLNTFAHQYEYDLDLRLIAVRTKLNNEPDWRTQAQYEYFLHGPLKRMVLAEDLQGIDYRYTVQGWLKSINHPVTDPGADGTNGVSSDAFGMTLEYFDGDYAEATNANESLSMTAAGGEELFDGNIGALSWNSPMTRYQAGIAPAAYVFQYDDKYQLKEAQSGTSDYTSQTISASGNELKVKGLDYDANGNILNLERFNGSGVSLHDFTYNYAANKNQLTSINGHSSYEYDELGQLEKEIKSDGSEQNLTYDVLGKVTEVKDESGNTKVTYTYDDRGFRLTKTVYDEQSQPLFTTWYIRDVRGVLLGLYDNKNADGTFAAAPSLKELPVYGNTKLGVLYTTRNELAFELKDHLGNVRALVAEANDVPYDAYFNDDTWDPIESEIFSLGEGVRVPDGIGNNKVVRVVAGAAGLIGPSKTLLVMPGDAVDVTVWAGFNTQGTETYQSPSAVLPLILSNLGGSPALGEVMSNSIQMANPASGVVASIGSNNPTTGAYLNWLYFDSDFNFKTGGFVEVPTGYGLVNRKDISLNIPGSAIDEPGFVYIYTSNESTTSTDAYFDDLQIVHHQGILRAASDYFPFGLKIEENSFSNLSPQAHRYGYQGQYGETEEETGWISFELRMYDPVIGRWLTVDPYRQYFSPYVAMGNNPILKTDPDGGFTTNPTVRFLADAPNQSEIKQNFARLEFKMNLWAGLAAEIDVGIFAVKVDLGTVDLVSFNLDVYFDTERDILWVDVSRSSSIFVELMEKGSVALKQSLNFDFGAIRGKIEKSTSTKEIGNMLEKHNGIMTPLDYLNFADEFLGKGFSQEHGTPFLVRREGKEAGLALGFDVGLGFLLGGNIALWYFVPDTALIHHPELRLDTFKK